jgi:sulfoxide reductase heme-binding subunit YedZ
MSLHTFTIQLAYGFLTLHLLTLLLDTHVPFSLRELLIPFSSDAREPWTGLGVVAMHLLVVIAVSGSLRRIVSFRVWKGLHLLAFPLYVLALAHGAGAGADRNAPWAFALYLTTGSLALWLTAYRLLRWNRRAERAPTAPSPPPFDRFAPAEGREQPSVG